MGDLLERMNGPALDALRGEPGVHVVGGAVRDVLLGRTPHELDIVVEGDAEPVARRAAERLGGSVVVHGRFGTATVRARGTAFDVVAARTETYPRPGALPEVHLGATLAQDLARRDFSVNAIAVALADGALTEFPGASDDLAGRRLRVLHERSFLDDPTRLLRLARYATRLGFAIEPDTDALAGAAVGLGAVSTVSGGRLGSELRLLLLEPQPAALLALDRHGLGAAVIDPAFAPHGALIEAALALTPPGARRELAAFAACLAGAADLRPVLDRLEFDATARGIVATAAEGAHSLRDALEAAELGDAELWRVLRRTTPEAVAVAGALGRGTPAEANARRWLEHVRGRRLAVTGDDFVAAGLSGPAVGDALEAARLAMLAGEAPGRAQQLAAGLAAVASG